MIPPTVGSLFTSITTIMNVQRLNSLRHWIFDMDGTLTVPSHDFPYMRRQLGMAEGDLDILAYVARHNEAEAAQMNQWLWDYEVDLAENAEPANLNGMSAKYAINGTTEGDVTIDVKTGWIIKSTFSQNLKGNLEFLPNAQMPNGMQVPITITNTGSVTQ